MLSNKSIFVYFYLTSWPDDVQEKLRMEVQQWPPCCSVFVRVIGLGLFVRDGLSRVIKCFPFLMADCQDIFSCRHKLSAES